MDNTVIIMRGLPGSGKSTIANKLAGNSDSLLHVFTADTFFIDEFGRYNFNASLLSKAHEFCKKRFSTAIEYKLNPILIDNTNTRKWEYEWYVEQAKLNDYVVQVITVGEFTDQACEIYAMRNQHGVPLETIKKMRDRFER